MSDTMKDTDLAAMETPATRSVLGHQTRKQRPAGQLHLAPLAHQKPSSYKHLRLLDEVVWI